MGCDQWLYWAKKLQSIAQAGLAYSHDKYDLDRFEEIRYIAADIVSKHTNLNLDEVKSIFCNEVGYQTPKIDVRAIVICDNNILLVRESVDGKWSLPGGWAEVDLSLKENVIKEMKEEAGLDVVPRRILAVLDRNKQYAPASLYGIYKIFILCDLVGGIFQSNIETMESGYFSVDELPDISIGRVTPEQIRLCVQLAKDSNLEIVFD